MKNLEDKELPHELFVTTGESIKKFNAIANNMSVDVKRSTDQTLKLSQGSVTVL